MRDKGVLTPDPPPPVCVGCVVNYIPNLLIPLPYSPSPHIQNRVVWQDGWVGWFTQIITPNVTIYA